MGPHREVCGLPRGLRCALSILPNWKPSLCLSLSLPGWDFLLGKGRGAGAKDVWLNTKPFSTRAPFTATGLATIELGFGRNSSVVLNWFFVSQVVSEFWIMQMSKHEVSVALALGITPS